MSDVGDAARCLGETGRKFGVAKASQCRGASGEQKGEWCRFTGAAHDRADCNINPRTDNDPETIENQCWQGQNSAQCPGRWGIVQWNSKARDANYTLDATFSSLPRGSAIVGHASP